MQHPILSIYCCSSELICKHCRSSERYQRKSLNFKKETMVSCLYPEGRVLRWGCAYRPHLGVPNRGSSISYKAVGRPTIKGEQSPLSPEGLAHPRAGRWDSYIPFMKAQHQGGADTMVSLVLGVAITPAHCVPAACTHPPVSDTLHLP